MASEKKDIPPSVALPIDAHVSRIALAVRRGNVVLVAEPGAGKTTRVPRALLEAGVAKQRIVVLEPRRLPTRLAAERVAFELGEKVGGRIGYQVRFDSQTGPDTRVIFVTEGILTRRLASDPSLSGVDVVVLDEFHERHLHADVALALLRRAQKTTRPDLRIVVMSATLEADRVASFLDAEVMHSEGRRFEVAVEYAERESEKPVAEQAVNAARRLLTRGVDGDVLVFLPGAGEIRRAMELSESFANELDVDVLPLHGELSPAEQDRAVRTGKRRKIIYSTNVAESSVTIEGVAAVVDSGVARVVTHSPWSGMSRLSLAKVSQASATQRMGRAGRVRAGTCVRLYTKHDYDTRPKHDAPEVARLDLADTVLALAAMGESDPRALPWFEAPPEASLTAAQRLLERLGAVDTSGAITEVGRAMQTLPVHPRAARLLVEGRSRNVGPRAALLAALLGERDVRQSSRAAFGRGGRERSHAATTHCDLLSRLEDLEMFELDRSRDSARSFGFDHGAAMGVLRSRDQLARLAGVSRDPAASLDDEDAALRLSVLMAFPDRVASRSKAGHAEVVFAEGGGGKLTEDSGVRDAQLLVAVDADGGQGRANVRIATAIDAEWVLEHFGDRVTDASETRFDADKERLERVSRLLYGAAVLDESRTYNVRTEDAGAALAAAVIERGLSSICKDGKDDALDALASRLRFAHEYDASLPTLEGEGLRAMLTDFAEGSTTFADLRRADFVSFVRDAKLDGRTRQTLDKLAPEKFTFGNGRGAQIHYEPGKPPWIESRLQDFFGLKAGPSVAGGRVAVVMHLLAPNMRAVQVTTDLMGFWDKHYPAIRKELMRQYPRHAWPDDPKTASPPEPRRR